MSRLTVRDLQQFVGVKADGIFGTMSRVALITKFQNTKAPAITEDDFKRAADRLGVPVGHIKGSRKVEAPRGAFDINGRPTVLYERHKFRNNCEPRGKYNASHPDLSGAPYGKGGYGGFAKQWDRLASACALDPHAAFSACSWGAFQVMGENAVSLGYASPLEMAYSLVLSEAAHLETYVRFIEANNLTAKLRACRPNDPDSCRPFSSGYNGIGYEEFGYHVKFATAIAS